MIKIREQKDKNNASYNPKRFEYDLVVEFPDGSVSPRQRRNCPKHICTEAAAYQFALERANHLAKTGTIQSASTAQTVADVVERLIEKSTESKSTKNRVKRAYQRYLKKNFGSKLIAHVSPADWFSVEEAIKTSVVEGHTIESLNGKPFTIDSRNMTRSSIIKIIKYANKLGISTQAHSFQYETAPKPKYYEKAFTKEEFAALQAAASKPQEQLILILGGLCGLRRSEIVAIDASKLYFDKSAGYTIKVDSHWIEAEKCFKAGTKWAASGTEVFVSKENYEKIKELLHLCRKPLTYKMVQQYFNLLCSKAGVKYRSLHCLRHYCATQMVEADIPIHIVSSVLGHTNLETTMRYVNENRKRTADAMRQFQENQT